MVTMQWEMSVQLAADEGVVYPSGQGTQAE